MESEILRVVSFSTSEIPIYRNTVKNPIFRVGYHNFLPNHKIWGLNKLIAFADDKLNVAKMMISLFDRVEKVVGKGENAGYQHFLLFPQFFKKACYTGLLKVGIV